MYIAEQMGIVVQTGYVDRKEYASCQRKHTGIASCTVTLPRYPK